MADHTISYDSEGNMYLEDVPGCTMEDDELRNSTITYSFGPIQFTDNGKMVLDLSYFNCFPNTTYYGLRIENNEIVLDITDGSNNNVMIFYLDKDGRPYMKELSRNYLDKIH